MAPLYHRIIRRNSLFLYLGIALLVTGGGIFCSYSPYESFDLPVTLDDLTIPSTATFCKTGVIHASHNFSQIAKDYAQKTDYNPVIMGSYFDFSATGEELLKACQEIASHNCVPYITLDQKIWRGSQLPDSMISTDSLLAGVYDTVLVEFAQAFSDFGDTVLLRFNHEHNGDWYPYSVVKQGGGADLNQNDTCDGIERYIKAWQYVHALVTNMSNTKVVWFYCVNAESFPKAPWNRSFSAYPGDDYVDVVGFDIYSYASVKSHMKSAISLAFAFCDEYRQMGLQKPVAIGEFGCNHVDDDTEAKGKWVESVFTVALQIGTSYLCYFDDNASDCQFCLTTDSDIAGYVNGMNSNQFFLFQQIWFQLYNPKNLSCLRNRADKIYCCRRQLYPYPAE